MAMHATELSTALRISAARHAEVPTTALLNHDVGSAAARFRFDLHVRRAAGTDTPVRLLVDALQIGSLFGLPPRRVVTLTVPLGTRVRTFAEAVRRRPATCTDALPLLRELASTPLPPAELTRYAAELTDIETAPALLRLLPPLGALAPDALEALEAALKDTADGDGPEDREQRSSPRSQMWSPDCSPFCHPTAPACPPSPPAQPTAPRSRTGMGHPPSRSPPSRSRNFASSRVA